MAFRVTIKNESGQSIPGTISWYDGYGNAVRFPTQPVPVGGSSFDDGLRIAGINIMVQSDGYVDFGIPANLLQDDNDIVLEKKPRVLVWAVAGLVSGYLLSKILRV